MIRGLTLWQPMAWAIAAGHKRIENRPWAPWRGVTHLAIHAGSKYYAPHAEQIREHIGIEVPARSELVFGAILCIVRLNGFVHEDDKIKQSEHDDPWFSGPFGWKLSDVHRLEPTIPRKGSLGLWRLDETETDEICNQVGGGKTIDELIDASSFGTPEAKAIRAQTPKHVVDDVMRRMTENEK